jgi:hypothetical protein
MPYFYLKVQVMNRPQTPEKDISLFLRAKNSTGVTIVETFKRRELF